MYTVLLAALVIQPTDLLGTMKVDVVSLVDTGQVVLGFEAYSSVRDGYRYLFSDTQNKRKFDASREYDIQLGGGCGKMGSLSGKGSPDRFAVYRGKVYLFASDGCRSSFMASPDIRIERDDPVPNATQEEAARGRRIFDQMVKWMGGSVALRNVRGYEEVVTGSYRQGENALPMELRRVYMYPDQLAHYDRYGDDTVSTVANENTGYFEMPSGRREPFFSAQAREMVRIRDHKLVPAAIKALAKGTLFADRGKGVLDVHHGGTGVRLWTNSVTGEVLALESRSRGPSGDYGALRLAFTKFQTIQGVKVPVSWNASFNGTPAPSLSATDLRVSIEPAGTRRK